MNKNFFFYIYAFLLFVLLISYVTSYILTEIEIISDTKVELLLIYDTVMKDPEIILPHLNSIDISTYPHRIQFFIFKNMYGLNEDIATIVYKYKLLSQDQLSDIRTLIDLKNAAIAEEEAKKLKKEQQRLRILSIIYLGYHVLICVAIYFFSHFFDDKDGSDSPNFEFEQEFPSHPFADFHKTFNPDEDDFFRLVIQKHKNEQDIKKNNNDQDNNTEKLYEEHSISSADTIRIKNDGKNLNNDNDDDSLESLEPFNDWYDY